MIEDVEPVVGRAEQLQPHKAGDLERAPCGRIRGRGGFAVEHRPRQALEQRERDAEVERGRALLFQERDLSNRSATPIGFFDVAQPLHPRLAGVDDLEKGVEPSLAQPRVHQRIDPRRDSRVMVAARGDREPMQPPRGQLDVAVLA